MNFANDTIATRFDNGSVMIKSLNPKEADKSWKKKKKKKK